MSLDPNTGRPEVGDDEPTLANDLLDTLDEALHWADVPSPDHLAPPPVEFYRPQRPQPAPRQRANCLPMLAVGVIVLLLILLGLFLPPIALWDEINDALNDEPEKVSDPLAEAGYTFVDLTADSPRLEADGLRVAVDPAALTGDYGVQALALSAADYLAGRAPAVGWFCGVDLPANHALASPVYSLAQKGTPPSQLSIQVAALPEVAAGSDTLALYAWNAVAERWDFLSSLAGDPGTLAVQLSYLPRCVAIFRDAEPARQVGVVLGLGDTFTPDVLTANARVYPAGLRPTASGALQGVLAPGFETGQGYAVMPLIQNFDDPAVIDVETLRRLLSDPGLRTQHARQIAAFTLGENAYAGVMLDYREVPQELRDSYAALIEELGGLLRDQNRVLAVVVPAAIYDSNLVVWHTGGYDWVALGRAADELVIRMPLDPLLYEDRHEIERLLDWAVSQADRGKLLLDFSALSVENQGSGLLASVTLDEALAYVGRVTLTPSGPVNPGETITARITHPDGIRVEVAQGQSPNVRYVGADGATLRTMWITDASALRSRMEWASRYHLAGVVVHNLMAPGTVSGLAEALVAYRLDQPVTGEPFEPSVNWTIRAGETVLLEMANALDKPLTFQVPEGQTDLIFDATLNDRSLEGASVAVAALPTPTPPPAEQPPAATEQPAEQPPAQPTSGSGLPDIALPTVDPAILATANVGTTFEPGGAVLTLDGRSIRAAGRTHLDWVQIDVPFTQNADPTEQQSVIDNAQANGFKVLLTVVGDPAEVAAAGWEEYLTAYAVYVGQLAMMGADGIEVWRDMNRAEGWPAGQINPAAYVQMLALAYNAIKTSHPDTLVISGGLMPAISAGETGQSDAVWNDDVYLAGMAEAGAGQFADCVGVLYVEGAVAPEATSGDPRGDAPIYYLPSLTDQVWNTFGGILPVCYTRLGYLTAEGLGTLPAGYEWAQTTTVGAQTQWLTAAVSGFLGGSKVRLLIIWNLDAVGLEAANLAGGYAIIRPDDSCPVCDALEPVLK